MFIMAGSLNDARDAEQFTFTKLNNRIVHLPGIQNNP